MGGVAFTERAKAPAYSQCPFFGHRDGGPIAECDRLERDRDDNGTMLCTARPVIEHLVNRLRQATGVAAAEWSRR